MCAKPSAVESLEKDWLAAGERGRQALWRNLGQSSLSVSRQRFTSPSLPCLGWRRLEFAALALVVHWRMPGVLRYWECWGPMLGQLLSRKHSLEKCDLQRVHLVRTCIPFVVY